VKPDLTTLGKIIGGGLPVGAVGGRADVMERLAPLGDVYQAGTLSGNPVSMAAGLATLRTLEELNPYAELEQSTHRLVNELKTMAGAAGLKVQIPQLGSVFSMFFADHTIRDFDDVQRTDQNHYVKMFHALLQRGVYLPPSPFEVSFLSTAHTEAVVDQALAAWREALAELG
jgi:glutamate-1-semialdehyde 2,1-aminomutase